MDVERHCSAWPDYAPACYTYAWSKALAVNLLTRFRKAGLRDSATAKTYRDAILAPGGSESMNVPARRCLGRDWTTEAYLARMKANESAAGQGITAR